MYGGRRVAMGDRVFVFDSRGVGLCAWGWVTAVQVQPRVGGVPLVSLTVQRVALVRQRLGRTEVRGFTDWGDGRPETEVNFKFYRQATDKLVGLTEGTAEFLARCF